jgi:hypothetical protein
MNEMIRLRISPACGLVLLTLFLLTTPTALAQDALLDQLTAQAESNLLTNGGFEADTPAYWTPTGTGATWSSEASRTPSYSLKLSGEGEASWSQEEAVLNWTPQIVGNQEIVVGGYVMTEGVNTDPASDDDKFQLVFEFFDDAGVDLLGAPLVIDVPQAEATSDGWVRIDNTSIGALSLPANAPSARITVRKGANAAGTVYVDDIFLHDAGDGDSPGDWFNPNVDASDTWYYWWDGFPVGGEDWPASQPFINTVTEEDAHTGGRSLKIVQNDPNASETVAISDRVPVTTGEPVLVSYWVKTADVPNPDSIGTAEYNIGMTALWYSSLESGAAGYNELGGLDIRLNGEYNPNVIPLAPRETDTDWTQYAFVVYPPEAAVGMELRLRYWHHFEGTTYWDDVSIVNVGGNALVGTSIDGNDDVAGELPAEFDLRQNYPNPFNPSTTIAFDLPRADNVTLEVYDVVGRHVATLVDGREMTAGRHEVRFDASGMSSGLYLYVMRTNERTQTRAMVLMK